VKHKLSRSLYAYWNRRRGDRTVPERSDIEPADLGPHLVHTFLIDIGVEGQARFRFCGSSLAMRYGRDLADEDFLALWQGGDRAALTTALAQMQRNGTGLVAGVTAETAGGGFVTFELMLLPLSGPDGCDRAIGSLMRIGGHEETNRVKARIVAQSLGSFRCLTGRRESLAQEQPGPYVREPERPPSPRARWGHLVVLPGGR
jgi:hypothetical protein